MRKLPLAGFPSPQVQSSPAPAFSPAPFHRRFTRRRTLYLSESLRISSSATESLSKSASWSARRAAVSDVQNASDLPSALSRSATVLKVHDLNSILRYFGDSKRWEDITQVFEWMKSHDKINVASYTTFIKFMRNSRNLRAALQVYNSIDNDFIKSSVSICNSILVCVVRNGNFDSAIKLFDQMKKDGLVPDAVTYSTLLSGCTKIKDGFSKALELVQEMEANDLQMDDVIYGCLIAICAANNLVKEAKYYFQRMKDEGHVPNIYHYSSLLNAYSVDGNYKDADQLLDDMRSSGLVPNKVVLTTLLKVYVRGGLFDKSHDLLVELKASGYAEEEMPYCLLMDGLAKAGLINEAKAIFDDMRSKKVKSDGYAHSIMICAYCRSKLLEEATQLAKDFEASDNKYDLVILNTLLTAYCRAGEMEHVMDLLKKMDKLAISPDGKTFHILVKYFMKEKLYQLAYRTVKDMYGKGHQLDEELCSNLIIELGQAGASSEAFAAYNMLRYGKRTLCKDIHEKVLNILVSGGLLKDAYVVMKDNASLISRRSSKRFSKSFMKSGNINLINDVVKAMHSTGHGVHPDVFQIAVERYIKKPEKKELLLQLLKWMGGQGYAVDSTSRNLLLKNSNLFGRQLIAEILSKQHRMSRLTSTAK